MGDDTNDTSDWIVADAVLSQDETTKVQLERAQRSLAFIEALDAGAARHAIKVYKPTPGAITPIVQVSDNHIEERVRPEDVPGAVNAYTPEIAKQRFDQLWQRVLLIIGSLRTLHVVDEIIVALLGDIITGFLHEDQLEGNYMSPTKATLLAEDLINSGIEFLLTKGNFKRIIVPCCYGNHGRTTQKKRASTAHDNSFEWLMYHHIAREWRKEKRIEFHIAQGDQVYLEAAGKVLRFLHGDSINYGGGVGGIGIPVLKAVSAWDKIRQADFTFMGHFHQCRDFGRVFVNGSMIGYNAYALINKCEYEPPMQQMVCIAHGRGHASTHKLWTDYLPKEVKA